MKSNPQRPLSEAHPAEAIRKIACKRCQFRKLRCSRTMPCSSCVTAKQDCEYRQRDEKRRPVSHEYVSSLESRVAWLESLIMRIKEADFQDREDILETLSFDHHPRQEQEHLIPGQDNVEGGDTSPLEPKLETDFAGSLICHGPTSIYQVWPNEPLPRDPPATSLLLGSQTDLEQIAGHFGINLDNETITETLMLFFKWQYPHFMFIYREAFLRDHYSNCRSTCKYWSPSLLLSICALGSLMRPDLDHGQVGDRFYAAAESIILVFGLSQPSITTVQTLLCLSFFEIGRGNSSKGWGLSGMAFRMAQDLGFQRDPKHWLSHDASLTSPEDLEIRRRIYWGCYASDKMISLVLGRPVFFHEQDAEVEWMERLPEFPEMVPWLPAGYTEPDKGTMGTSILVQCFREQVNLLRLAETMISNLFMPSNNLSGASRKSLRDSSNLALNRWHASLPGFIQWNKWEPTSKVLLPSVAALHVLFHSVRIVLNSETCRRTYLGGDSENTRAMCLSSAQDIISIVRKYRSSYGLKHTPFIFIYGIVQALKTSQAIGIAQESNYLINILEESSATWDLARHIRVNLQ